MAAEPVIVIGHGLAGLVAAFELSKRKIPTLIVDQENANNIGGQAFWSLGGLFIVDSTEQRRLGIRDSRELALQDWLSSAQFDREEDYWPRQWAKAYVDFAADDLEEYVKGRGLSFLFDVGWAERGSGSADGHGNTIPRMHRSWGTGPELVRVFLEPVLRAQRSGIVQFKHRHVVDELIVDPTTGRATGIRGRVLEDDDAIRGVSSSRITVDTFELRASAVIVSSGGIGGNIDAVKARWPVERLGPSVPQKFVVGVPAHVDGRMMQISERAGAHIVNSDRMWNYTEGLQNWNPIWPGHGIRIISGPSPLWLDANGKRMPPHLFPSSDNMATLKHICHTGHHYSWFILNQTIAAKEMALSGSEQNPVVTDKSVWHYLGRLFPGNKGTIPVQNFLKHGKDFVIKESLDELVQGMNHLAAERDGPALELDKIRAVISMRDSQFDNAYSKDTQALMIHNWRSYWPDRIWRVAKPHRILDEAHGPLIAVRLNIVTRKTLGGLETNLQSNVMRADGTPFPGLYAAGEVAGFGGGGVHGYNALEGTFLGGCIFSGRAAGRAVADEVSLFAKES